MPEKKENINPVFYTVKEVADILKVEEITVREALRKGTLGGQKIFNQWRISQESLDEFMNVRR
jgi:excisionase family DNA binding protein